MNKLIIMAFLTSILTLMGCKSNEDQFLQKNKVIYYNTKEFAEYEEKAPVKLDQAWKIQKEFEDKNKETPENWLFFIINGDYVFNSAINPKEAKTFLNGIWVNSKTGKARYYKSDIRLGYKTAYNGDGMRFQF